ncbi:hypothetical protein M4914_14525 [Streptomyces somaliensis DSM 40738]|uniref:hypothetical protein n=1 Tax=Streptomyces somaliensis TaxID=78355 RepID=UPI0021C2CA01|nr:hypothetical protein [Streptomyces somaliensis]MCQ0024046.1 hypothetical protein [Streptomyces somaliensis DSM 40738]
MLQPVGHAVACLFNRLLVEVVDVLARCLRRFPDTFQDTVFGMKKLVDRSLKVRAVLGRPARSVI